MAKCKEWIESALTRKLSKSNAVAILMLTVIATLMFIFNAQTFIWMDEYLFYRLSDGLPGYSVSPDWFYKDFPETVNENDPRGAEGFRKVIETVYNTPVYSHTPLATILVYPIVKLATDNPRLDMTETRTLRIIPILLSTITFALIYVLLKRRIGRYALLTFIPILLSCQLLAGAMFFYWDVFMAFFFVLTLFLMEMPNAPKWAKYVTACCLVNTKMFLGPLFLVPLIIKEKKLILCTFSLLPFWLYTLYITGDPIYWYHYYLLHTSVWNASWSIWVIPNLGSTILGWNFITYLVLTIGCLVLVKKYPVYIAFYVLTIAYGVGIGFGLNHMSHILYSGALVFPLVFYHLLRKFKIQGIALIRQQPVTEV